MMKQFPWTAAATKALILFFRDHENLYNPEHKLYKNRMLRDKHLSTISAIIGCTPEEAKARFRNLRTYFFRENHKVTASKSSEAGSSCGEPYCSQWEFFEDLTFLRSCHHPRSHTAAAGPGGTAQGSDESDLIMANDEACSNDDDADAVAVENGDGGGESVVPPENGAYGGDCSDAAEVLAVLSQEPPLKKWRRQFEVAENFRKEEPQHSAPPSRQDSTSDGPKDENYYFAMMIAQELRLLEPMRRDMLKLRLFEAVLQAKHNVMFERPASSALNPHG
uniref:Protein containing MADF and GT1 domain n=1 Tax=Rhipicephalus zambeziensis TaxID=60191 RepID=A0A224Z0I7_9ACAR